MEKGSLYIRTAFDVADPQERLARAIIRAVTDDFISAGWSLYCWEHILREFQSSEIWKYYTFVQGEIGKKNKQIEEIVEQMRKNANTCFRMGGRTDFEFPYAASKLRDKETTDSEYAKQLSVNHSYIKEWRTMVDNYSMVKKTVSEMKNEISTGKLGAAKLEHEAIVRNVNRYADEKKRNMQWFKTDWAKVLMMNDIDYHVICDQLEKRSKMNIRRIKSARIKCEMHPYDFRNDTKQQKSALNAMLAKDGDDD